MAQLTVAGGDLVLRLRVLEIAGAMHRSIRVPLSAVEAVRASDTMWGELSGMRMPGTGFPRVIALGTWRRKGSKDFAAIYRNTGVVITLHGMQWSRLLVSCDDPRAVCERIDAHR